MTLAAFLSSRLASTLNIKVAGDVFTCTIDGAGAAGPVFALKSWAASPGALDYASFRSDVPVSFATTRFGTDFPGVLAAMDNAAAQLAAANDAYQHADDACACALDCTCTQAPAIRAAWHARQAARVAVIDASWAYTALFVA